MYGSQTTYLDGLHGFVGAAAPLIRGRHLLEASSWSEWEQRIVTGPAAMVMRFWCPTSVLATSDGSSARAFAMHGIAQTEADEAAYGQLRYSLWTGDPGFAIYLWDCLRGQAAFPTLDAFYGSAPWRPRSRRAPTRHAPGGRSYRTTKYREISRCGTGHCTTKYRGAWHKPDVSQCRPTFHNPE